MLLMVVPALLAVLVALVSMTVVVWRILLFSGSGPWPSWAAATPRSMALRLFQTDIPSGVGACEHACVLWHPAFFVFLLKNSRLEWKSTCPQFSWVREGIGVSGKGRGGRGQCEVEMRLGKVRLTKPFPPGIFLPLLPSHFLPTLLHS